MILNLHLSLDPARHGCPQWLNQAWQVFQLLWIKVDIPMHHLPHSPQGFGSLSVHTKRSLQVVPDSWPPNLFIRGSTALGTMLNCMLTWSLVRPGNRQWRQVAKIFEGDPEKDELVMEQGSTQRLIEPAQRRAHFGVQFRNHVGQCTELRSPDALHIYAANVGSEGRAGKNLNFANVAFTQWVG